MKRHGKTRAPILSITSQGRTSLVDMVLVNKHLQMLCENVGARFLDLAKVLGPGSIAADDGQYSGDRVRHVVGVIAEAVTLFLAQRNERDSTRVKEGSRPSRTQPGGSLGSGGTACEETLPRTLPKEGRGGAQEAVVPGKAGSAGAA